MQAAEYDVSSGPTSRMECICWQLTRDSQCRLLRYQRIISCLAPLIGPQQCNQVTYPLSIKLRGLCPYPALQSVFIVMRPGMCIFLVDAQQVRDARGRPFNSSAVASLLVGKYLSGGAPMSLGAGGALSPSISIHRAPHICPFDQRAGSCAFGGEFPFPGVVRQSVESLVMAAGWF